MSREVSSGSGGFGFTIMEVMVAVLILAISLVSIFGAQFSAVATVEYSRNVTHAVQLARCKMSEIELDFQLNGGFEEGDIIESGECCEIVEGERGSEDYLCRWEIKTIQMPDISQMMMGGDDAGVMDDMSGGMMGDMLGGGGDDMGDMGMGLVGSFMPMVTDLLQQAMRRVTVVVEWKEGAREENLEIVQYVTHPTQGPLGLMQQAATMDQLSEEAGLNDPAGGVRGEKSSGGKNDR